MRLTRMSVSDIRRVNEVDQQYAALAALR